MPQSSAVMKPPGNQRNLRPSSERWTSPLFFVVLLLGRFEGSSETVFDECPKVCFCNSPSKIVYCSRRGLTSIPDGISPDSLQLNLNGNVFESGLIRRANLSHHVGLEHLYMSECGIEAIQVGAFEDLVNLRWLDMSNNRLKSIEARTFRGLKLHHLFLNGNRNIQLVPDSFDQLVTTGLYLHDCSLSDVNAEQFAPLNTTLRYLWLNGNELQRLDSRFLFLFSRFLHLRLGFNPLHCNCDAVWLKEFYDKHGDIFKGAMPPSCLTPQRLKGRFFSDLSLYDLRCQTPMFSRVEVYFGSAGQGQMKCAAVGEPAPLLYWIQPSGKTTKYSPVDNDDVTENEALLSLKWNDADENDASSSSSSSSSNPSGMYICIARNAAGNVTLTIDVPRPGVVPPGIGPGTLDAWQQPSTTRPAASSTEPPPRRHNIDAARQLDAATQSSNNIQYRLLGDSLMLGRQRTNPSSPSIPPAVEDWLSRQNYTSLDIFSVEGGGGGGVDRRPSRNDDRVFTVSEMVLAVIGTHLCTLVLCCAAVFIVYRTRWRKWKTMASFDQRFQRGGQYVGCSSGQEVTYSPSSSHTGGATGATTSGHDTSETVYLNGVHRHKLQSYVDDPFHYSIKR